MLNYNLIISDYLCTSSPVHSRINKICVAVINNNNLTVLACAQNGNFIVEYVTWTRILHGSFSTYLQQPIIEFTEYTYHIYIYCVNEQMEYLTNFTS
jgi:hypothetical protein